MTRILTIITALLLCGCSWRDPGYLSAAHEYSQRNAKDEALANFKDGKFAIYSAMGIGLYFPGLDTDVGSRIMRRYSTIPLGGTSDAIESSAHGKYVDSATSFASTYNRQMVELLVRSGKLPASTQRGFANSP